jgi:hypothetical protein
MSRMIVTHATCDADAAYKAIHDANEPTQTTLMRPSTLVFSVRLRTPPAHCPFFSPNRPKPRRNSKSCQANRLICDDDDE